MQQIEDLDRPRRQLGEEDDLERDLDRDERLVQTELKNKIIFSIQGLGGIRTIKHQDKLLEAYIKGPHCQQSIKDLVKFVRGDTKGNPRARLILSSFNIVDSDLLQLLILQVQDKKLSFWIIALLALITAKPSQEVQAEQREKLLQSLRQYKKAFIKHECFKVLMIHISDFYGLPDKDKERANFQMLQFIILLLRNLVQIPNGEKAQNLHSQFLVALIKEEMFNPILYILQNERSVVMSKIDIPLLQMLYYTFTCFNPQVLYSTRNKSLVQASIACKKREAPLPTRHSRFLPAFQIKNESGIKKISYKLQASQDKPLVNQKKMPLRMTDYKKVIKLQLQQFGQNFMKMEIQSEGKQKSIGEIVIELTREFIEVEFQLLVKLVFDNIFKQTPKVTDQNVIQYLLLCSWALQVVRSKYHYQRLIATSEMDKNRVQFHLNWIVDILQPSHFELIYQLLMQEATREKKKLFKINVFNAGVRLFQSYLNVVDDISNSMNLSDRKNANVIMANIFRHDIARIIRFGFQIVSHDGIISNLIILTHRFFKLLSVYSEGKVLTIQTNRLLKRKRKQQQSDSDDERNIINQANQEDNQYQNEKQTKGKGEQAKYQQRKYNQKSQFAILAEYSIITKYVMFLREEKFAVNSDQLNEAIFYYFMQIKKLLNGQWLFYQAETICIFQKMLAHHEWVNKNKQKAKFVKGICLSFIRLMRKNPLALVESLFRYSTLSLKDSILNNYQLGYQEIEEQQANMFTDE